MTHRVLVGLEEPSGDIERLAYEALERECAARGIPVSGVEALKDEDSHLPETARTVAVFFVSGEERDRFTWNAQVVSHLTAGARDIVFCCTQSSESYCLKYARSWEDYSHRFIVLRFDNDPEWVNQFLVFIRHPSLQAHRVLAPAEPKISSSHSIAEAPKPFRKQIRGKFVTLAKGAAFVSIIGFSYGVGREVQEARDAREINEVEHEKSELELEIKKKQTEITFMNEQSAKYKEELDKAQHLSEVLKFAHSVSTANESRSQDTRTVRFQKLEHLRALFQRLTAEQLVEFRPSDDGACIVFGLNGIELNCRLRLSNEEQRTFLNGR